MTLKTTLEDVHRRVHARLDRARSTQLTDDELLFHVLHHEVGTALSLPCARTRPIEEYWAESDALDEKRSSTK